MKTSKLTALALALFLSSTSMAKTQADPDERDNGQTAARVAVGPSGDGKYCHCNQTARDENRATIIAQANDIFGKPGSEPQKAPGAK